MPATDYSIVTRFSSIRTAGQLSLSLGNIRKKKYHLIKKTTKKLNHLTGLLPLS